MSWYFIAKPRSGSTAPSFGTRSRTWPYDASTSKSLPRYFSIVRAFAGDSTMTTFLAMSVQCGRRPVPADPMPRSGVSPPGGAKNGKARATRRWSEGSVDPAWTVRENEILHMRVGLFVARLAEQDHHHDPFDLLDIDFIRVEGQ